MLLAGACPTRAWGGLIHGWWSVFRAANRQRESRTRVAPCTSVAASAHRPAGELRALGPDSAMPPAGDSERECSSGSALPLRSPGELLGNVARDDSGLGGPRTCQRHQAGGMGRWATRSSCVDRGHQLRNLDGDRGSAGGHRSQRRESTGAWRKHRPGAVDAPCCVALGHAVPEARRGNGMERSGDSSSTVVKAALGTVA